MAPSRGRKNSGSRLLRQPFPPFLRQRLAGLLQRDDRVEATEGERVAQHRVHRLLAREVRDIVEVAGRVRVDEVCGRRDDTVTQGADRGDEFDCAGSAERMAATLR